MRILLTAIVFCSLLLFNANAQPIPEVKAVVSPVMLNVVYVGVDNPIHVAVPGYTCEQIIVTTNNGKIKGQGCTYMLRPESVGRLQVYISVARNTEVALIDSFNFRSNRVPDPLPHFGRYSIFDDTINISVAKTILQIFTEPIDSEFEVRFIISEFTMKVIRKGSLIFTAYNNSPGLSQEMQIFQQGFEKGDVLIFEQIKAESPDGTERHLRSLQYVLY